MQLAEEQQVQSDSDVELSMPGKLTQSNSAFAVDTLSGSISSFHDLPAAGVAQGAA